MGSIDATPHTDEELVRLSLTSTEHFASLIDRYEDKMRRYIARLGVRVAEDQDDIMQEIFIKVYQNLNAFDQSLKFSSWIYRIAHNQTISFFRYTRARPAGYLFDITEDAFQNIASEINAIEAYEIDDARAKLVECLDVVDKKYRDVLILKFFEYKSYDEISDILMLPPGTVAVRLNRAKEALRRIMVARGYIHEQ